MMNETLGVVVGKFYPPHRGHRYLVDTACAKADRVVVFVVDSVGETPNANTRAEWVREIHPNVEVQVIPDIYKDTDSRAWAWHINGILINDGTATGVHNAADYVFTSEDYGYRWAGELADIQGHPCEHVWVDRKYIDVSGTMIRDNPARYWDYIDAPVRAHYAKRICVLGAESTGSTTLTKALAHVYGTIWVPEYGRDYTVEKFKIGTGDQWLSADFVRIAVEQQRLEDKVAREAPVGLIICDTDAFATALWEEIYLGHTSEQTWAIADSRSYDLYVLTDYDIPWENDGLRLGDETRAKMTKRFEEELDRHRANWIKVSGSRMERLVDAADAISDFYG